MSEMAFVHSIRHSSELLDSLGRLRSFRQPTSLPVSTQFNMVALDTDSPYADIFMAGLQLSHYNVLLTDFSFFQFSRASEEDVRLAFYPSPFGPQEFSTMRNLTELLEKGVMDFESYSYLMELLKTNSKRPLVRYEYSTVQYVAGRHPASHIHFGTYGEDRWPVKRRLSPLAFTALIAKLYFTEDWEVLTDGDSEGRKNELDQRYLAAREACGFTEGPLFGPHEELQFYVL